MEAEGLIEARVARNSWALRYEGRHSMLSGVVAIERHFPAACSL